jgi:hypothetical protein
MQIDGKQLKDTSVATAKLAAGAEFIQRTGSVAFTNNQSIGGNRLTSLGAGVNATDAVNKSQLDDARFGIDVKTSCRAATTAAIGGASYTATGGTSGRGLFEDMPDEIDGVTLVVGDRVLVKNQGAAAQNGIWEVTTLGTGANGIWNRAEDFDADDKVTANAFTFIEEGTANADTGWMLTTDDPITVGGGSGTALVFQQFSSAGTLDAGDGLQKIADEISILPDGDSVSVSSGGLKAAVPATGNKHMTASVTSSDEDAATATALAATPAGDGYVAVVVNGQLQHVGSGTKASVDCYFSGDAGSTARTFAQIVSGDTLHWNGSVAGFQLAATDRIDFLYNVII